jgi:sterol desaturase/sphingolipid hydroxylase (fatty acid hydroxylase superfamily)
MVRAYEVVSGVVFAVVAVAHAWRAAQGWAIQVGAWPVPVWPSWVVALAAAFLSVWAFRRAKARRR